MTDENAEAALQIEACEVLKEIKFAVGFAGLSALQSSEKQVFCNIKTKESKEFTVELTDQGFKIVGHKFDLIDQKLSQNKPYETIYALLDANSPGYRKTFSDTLMAKLENLKNLQENHSTPLEGSN